MIRQAVVFYENSQKYEKIEIIPLILFPSPLNKRFTFKKCVNENHPTFNLQFQNNINIDFHAVKVIMIGNPT
jgi:hypothetical protein